ncbi:hypothetical protein TNCV_1100061 [Trichonephila clavipes]|nr:hypothetical protein TNCV_1100061 [Trichonephila clavipes]
MAPRLCTSEDVVGRPYVLYIKKRFGVLAGQDTTHCRAHLVQQQYKGESYPADFTLNAVHEWQYHRLNSQTDVQISSRCAWENRERAFNVFEIAPQTMAPVVGSVCLDRRQLSFRRISGILLTNARPSLVPSHKILSSENTTVFTTSSNERLLDTTSVAIGNGMHATRYLAGICP